MEKHTRETLIRLIEVEKSIKTIYNHLDKLKKEEYLDYLKIAKSIESSILSELNFQKENQDNLLTSYNYLLNQHSWKKEDKLLIYERLENYISNKINNRNPFPSIENLEQENADIIEYRVARDYLHNIFFFLPKEIEKQDNPIMKQQLMEELNNLYFRHIYYEDNINNPVSKLMIDGQQLCVELGHKKDLVHKIYSSFTNKLMESALLELLNNADTYETDITPTIAKIGLKSTCLLPTDEELNSIYSKYKNDLWQDPTLAEFYPDIITSFLNTIQEANNEKKQYKKVNYNNYFLQTHRP